MTDASTRARSAVGLYGDPTVTWSVLLRARLARPVDETSVLDRLARHVRQLPQLGGPPAVVSTSDIDGMLESFAARPFRAGDALLRVAVGAGQPELVLAAHHGAVDGLGLLGLLGVALDVELTSNATGIGTRPAELSFPLSAVRRVGEAVFAPPARIRPCAGAPADVDVFVEHSGPRRQAGTAALITAATNATVRWNREHGSATHRVVAAVGASRRPGHELRTTQDSAYLRLRLDDADVLGQLAAQPPEPAFPAFRNPLASVAIRLLAPRLGSTFLVSNLGVVDAPDPVRALSFYPVASGRSGVAFGAATLGETTTITVRARRQDFDRTATSSLLDLVFTELASGAR